MQSNFLPGHGQHNATGQSAECFSRDFEELSPDIQLPAVKCASNTRSLHNNMKALDQMQICQTSILAIKPAEQGCFLTGHANPIDSSFCSKSAEYRYVDLDLNATDGLMTQDLTVWDQVERTCHGEAQMLRCVVNGPAVPSIVKEVSDESFPASPMGKSAFIESLSAGDLNYLNMEKGNEQAVSDTQGSKCTSGKSEDSHDSVESCSSKRLVSTGKRARNYDLEMSAENKRLKRKICEGPSSGSLIRRGGSFMNWVAAITNGFCRSSETTPLAFPPSSHHIEKNLDCRSLSCVKGKAIDVDCGNTGFKSIFESLYLPGLKMKTSTHVPRRTNTAASKELNFGSKNFGYSNGQLQCKKTEFGLQNMLPSKGEEDISASKFASHGELLNVGSLHIVGDGSNNESHNEVSMPGKMLQKKFHDVKDSPSANHIVAPADSIFCEDARCDFKWNDDLGNVGSVCSVPKNGCQSPSRGNGASKVLDVAESSSKLASNGKSKQLQNLWITRFSPKISSISSNSEQNIQAMDLATDSSTQNYNVLDPLFQNNVAFGKDPGCLENCCLPSAHSTASGMDAGKLECLKKGKQKLESSPSHKFQKTEALASTFVKRLDMCRNLGPSKIP